MELSTWFDYQLRSTLDGFTWAVREFPVERLYIVPPVPLKLGEWSVAQHIVHLLEYEERLALPSMHQWLGAPAPIRQAMQSEQDLSPIEEILMQFESVRKQEIELLPQFSQEQWGSTRQTTFWGDVSLKWLISKTYQHTLEHTHDILSMDLFWDRRVTRMGAA